jgi:hypothetical protein
MSFDARPFVVDDTEIYAVTNAPAGPDHVVTKAALLSCANAYEGLPRPGVERVGLELYTDAAQALEGMAQLQVFCFRVDSGVLPGWGNPRPTDLHTTMLADDAEITG